MATMSSTSTQKIDKQLYEPNAQLLKDRVILVTGASRGIGRAVAKTYANFGATVILLGRTIKELESLYDEIEAQGSPQAAIYPLNLCNATPEHYAELKRTIDQNFGRLDGLLHNAGMLGTLTPIEHYEIDTWYQIMQVNLNSVFLATQALLPLMKRAQDASIIFTSSNVGVNPKAYWGAYAIASAGSEAFMKILSEECETHTNVRANSIMPERVRTALRASVYPAEDKNTLTLPEDIMSTYLYLMGPDGKHINGQSFSATKELYI